MEGAFHPRQAAFFFLKCFGRYLPAGRQRDLFFGKCLEGTFRQASCSHQNGGIGRSADDCFGLCGRQRPQKNQKVFVLEWSIPPFLPGIAPAIFGLPLKNISTVIYIIIYTQIHAKTIFFCFSKKTSHTAPTRLKTMFLQPILFLTYEYSRKKQFWKVTKRFCFFVCLYFSTRRNHGLIQAKLK